MLLKDESFDIETYLHLVDDDRAQSAATTDDIDNLLVEQIRRDVRAERWDSLKNCG